MIPFFGPPRSDDPMCPDEKEDLLPDWARIVIGGLRERVRVAEQDTIRALCDVGSSSTPRARWSRRTPIRRRLVWRWLKAWLAVRDA